MKEEKCGNCGTTDFGILSNNITNRRICMCGHSWEPSNEATYRITPNKQKYDQIKEFVKNWGNFTTDEEMQMYSWSFVDVITLMQEWKKNGR